MHGVFRYSKSLDGSGKGTGWLDDGSCELEGFDLDLQRLLENHCVGLNTQFSPVCALNAPRLHE